MEPGSPDDVAALDYINRDPNELNHAGRGLQYANRAIKGQGMGVQYNLKTDGTLFHDIIGEPEGAHSSECVWRNSYKCYYIGKNCCYTVLTTLCGIPSAFCWGCNFACSTFYHIWCVTPCFFIFNLHFSCVARFFATLVHCCCDPIYESMALMCTKIFIHMVGDSKPYRTLKMEELNIVKDAEMNQV